MISLRKVRTKLEPVTFFIVVGPSFLLIHLLLKYNRNNGWIVIIDRVQDMIKYSANCGRGVTKRLSFHLPFHLLERFTPRSTYFMSKVNFRKL